MANSARGQEMAKRDESESVRVDAPPTVTVGVPFAPRACRFDRGGAATSGSLAIGPATGPADFTVTIGISQRGSAIESSGMTSALTSASVQMKWRSAADARRNVYASRAGHAEHDRGFDDVVEQQHPAGRNLGNTSSLCSRPARLVDHAGQPVKLTIRQARGRIVEERGDSLLRRTIEKRLKHVAQR